MIERRRRPANSGRTKAPLYRTWRGMIDRCHRPGDKDFPEYGERGIVVCSAWRESYEQFASDMGVRPSAKHSIDRVDGSRGYSAENCRWATPKQQANNARHNVMATLHGRTDSVFAWCVERSIPTTTVYRRIHAGWTPEKALTIPARRYTKAKPAPARSQGGGGRRHAPMVLGG